MITQQSDTTITNTPKKLKKLYGKSKSITYMSRLNRFVMRPTGFTSKNDTGAPTTCSVNSLWYTRDAFTRPRACSTKRTTVNTPVNAVMTKKPTL